MQEVLVFTDMVYKFYIVEITSPCTLLNTQIRKVSGHSSTHQYGQDHLGDFSNTSLSEHVKLNWVLDVFPFHALGTF